MPAAGEPGVDEDINQDTGTEQRVEEDDGGDGGQTAVTGILRTASSGGDEGPKGSKDEGNQTTNDQSQIEVGRTDRGEKCLDTSDSSEDRSKEGVTHAGSSRGETASGADIAS
ncbi:hypothetical protein K435DRAFT_872453 [Dendrothele bispora CBS 962.96]|uniref:Uncharacterized protein n=1 Tax=Dendrothele bispora (strain CBS 962.96) TaxID=1314807 RepID=A0A4V4HC84_DENBC|nr:hypothetical protein K435DRAFT_872453 [Dendrothele bispora CBS 962.96]